MPGAFAMSITDAALHDCGLFPASTGLVPHDKLNIPSSARSCLRFQEYRRVVPTGSRKLTCLSVNACDGLHGLDATGLFHDNVNSFRGPPRPRAINGNAEPSDGATWSTSEETQGSLRAFRMQLVHWLGDFGFEKGNIWEASIGLMLAAGSLLLGARVVWMKGSQLRSQSRKYEAVIEFPLASGITIGTPVRVRGVDVGTVVGVRPSLERIDVSIQVMDSNVLIPRNALVEVNQSGLLGETLVDITPRHPLPLPSVGPLDPGCSAEGLIVCDRGRIRGEQGVSLDELVGLCGKMVRKMNDSGVNEVFNTAEQVGVALDNTKPLLDKVETIVGNIEPAMKELRDGRLLKDVTQLVKMVTKTAHSLRNSTLTSENSRILHDSVDTLTKTMKRIESISEDVSAFTGDAGTRNNLKQLIESLSRLVND